jgi:hypothetical protein
MDNFTLLIPYHYYEPSQGEFLHFSAVGHTGNPGRPRIVATVRLGWREEWGIRESYYV